METSGLQTRLPLSEETEEPWPKKIKIDKSHMSSEDKHQVLQNLYYADKKSTNNSFSFPEVLWNFSQNGLELQEEKNADLNNVRPFGRFKPCMNANLQSRLLENIPLHEELTLGDNCYIIRDANSKFNENNTLVTKSDSWGLHTKERSKSINSDITLKGNESPTVNTIFYIMIEKLIKTIDKNVPLFKNVPEFHSNENGKDCYEHDVFRSEQYHFPESAADGENINGKTSHLCLLASCLVKKRKSEFGYDFYENKDVNEDGNFLMYKMYTQFPANNYLRTNKASYHMYMPFSRICGIRDHKLVKCAFFKLLLQDKKYNANIPSKKNESSVFSQGLLFNIQQRGVSKESRTKECLIFSKNTMEDYIVTVSGSEKEQMSKQFVFSSNQISPKNNILNSTLWEEQLCNSQKLQDPKGHFQLLNYLSSSKNIFEKLNKCASPQILVTVETCLQEKKIKTSSENIAFPIKKQQTSHILRASRKHKNRTFRNNINLASKSKYVLKFSRTCGRGAVNKNKYDNCKVFHENSCAFIDTEIHFSSLDKYRKIYLNTDLEEVYLNSFLKKAKLNDKNSENCSKGYTVADTRITFSILDTQIKNCVPPILITDVPNSNSFLMQENKKQYLQYININSQWSKYEINNAAFPNKCFSDDDQYFTSTISHRLCKDQDLAVGVKKWHSKIALHENRDKQYNFKFGNIKGVLQSQPIRRSRDSKRLKHPKIKKVDENILLQKYVLPRSLYSSELESTKQNGGNFNKIENEGVDQSYLHKSYQNQIVPYSKGESAQYTESEDSIMVESHTLKEHLKHTIEEHFPTKLKDSYEFEMKSQFDTVLEELSMFNEIDKKIGTRLSCGKINILQEYPLEQNCPDSILGEDARNICENMTFSTCTTALNFNMTVTQKENKESLFKDTVVNQTGKPVKQPGNRHDSSSSSISDEALFCSPSEEHCDSGYKQLSPWKPAFVCHTLTKKERYSFQNEKGNYLLDGIRVQPLKTCRGPLRIGLSRKANLKQLHPYLK